MKFDLDTAWRDTRRYLTENTGLLATMSGIFVFLPYAAMLILMPLVAEMPEVPEGASFDIAMEALSAFYSQVWWMFLLVSIIVTIGQLAMLALIGRRPHPTVGDAIRIGGKAILPAWIAFILQSLGVNFVMLLVLFVASATGSPPVLFFGGVVAFALAIYLTTRFSLVLPIASIEGGVNPIQLLTNSWKRTKGHALRLLGFYVLMAVAAIVVALVFTMITGAILALFGAVIAETVGIIISAAVIAALIVLFTAVLAAVHLQLGRLSRSGGVRGSTTAPQDDF
ncbi:hypothetical protein E3U23_01320 [Erythrobacter litoralis]|uniref:hypothetical protein n=1 Tax=Erythrobacter litoralis TaxID=39960 RepID=UPI0024350264|nr:hypothetical protein [Erythrobacter litoralis]MDG6077838.1 hypothetical protein [Erythrobacter litoralis]